MTKLLPLLVTLFAVNFLTAQVTLNSDYFPAIGDTLQYARAADISSRDLLDQDGADRIWDFGDRAIRIPIDRPVVELEADDVFPQADLKIEIGDRSAEYYRVTDTEFTLVGVLSASDIFPNFIVRADVVPVRPVRRAPLSYNDVFTSNTENQVTISPDSIPTEILEGLPDEINATDSIRLITTSDRRDTVDAYGTVLLNDRSYEVLREVSTETITTRIEVLTFLGYQDVTGLLQTALPDSVARFLGPQTPTVSYTYWNPDNKEYIVRAETAEATGEVFELSFKRTEITNSTDGPFTTQARISVYPNPANHLATFQIDGIQNGRYELLLVNMLGRTVASRSFLPAGNPTRLELQVGHLPRGLYLYSLRNERGRTVATKRLLVGGN